MKKEESFMKQYDVILFDLDGTITDPGEGITKSVAYALQQSGITVTDLTTLYPFIGPPLRDSFQRYFGQTPQQAEESVAQYRVYYRKQGIFECLVYPGIEELLKKLSEAGKTIVLATSKPEEFAVQLLEHFGLDRYFTCMAGATLDDSRDTKDKVIAYALERVGLSDTSKAVMIGDREYDILGAKKFGIDGIGVTFGYGSRQELEEAGAIALADSAHDLEALLL
jgi:phosphoglycolate phosphatase